MVARGNTVWTDEQCDALKSFVNSGLSYSQAATAINEAFDTRFTRCAATGQGWRLGLSSPAKIRVAPKKRERTPMVIIKPTPKVVAVQIRCAEIKPHNVALLDLDHDGCRHPSGDGPFLFCNHKQQEGSSYCPDHEALCHALAPRLTDEERRIRRMRWKKLQKFTEAA
jgi:hypothetical protein